MSKTSPTARALKDMRGMGWEPWVVEKFNPYTRTRLDLFNFADIVAMGDGMLRAVQVTSGAHHAERVKKILNEPRAAKWVECGGVVEAWSYAKQGAKGTRKLWTLRRETITKEMFDASATRNEADGEADENVDGSGGGVSASDGGEVESANGANRVRRGRPKAAKRTQGGGERLLAGDGGER